jgi:hypothetical protein
MPALPSLPYNLCIHNGKAPCQQDLHGLMPVFHCAASEYGIFRACPRRGARDPSAPLFFAAGRACPQGGAHVRLRPANPGRTALNTTGKRPITRIDGYETTYARSHVRFSYQVAFFAAPLSADHGSPRLTDMHAFTRMPACGCSSSAECPLVGGAFECDLVSGGWPVRAVFRFRPIIVQAAAFCR